MYTVYKKSPQKWILQCKTDDMLKPIRQFIPNRLERQGNPSVQDYIDNIVIPITEKYNSKRDRGIQQLKGGVECHRRIQLLIASCDTLHDVVFVAFGGSYCASTETPLHLKKYYCAKKLHTFLKEEEIRLLIKRDAGHFIARCAEGLGITEITSNLQYTELEAFAKTVRVVAVYEKKLKGVTSTRSSKQRIPDLVIFATRDDAPARVWMCVVELKTFTQTTTRFHMCNMRLKYQQARMAYQRQKTGYSGPDQYHAAIFQCDDTHECINRFIASQSYPYDGNIFLSTDAYVWGGFQSILKSKCGGPCILSSLPVDYSCVRNRPLVTHWPPQKYDENWYYNNPYSKALISLLSFKKKWINGRPTIEDNHLNY